MVTLEATHPRGGNTFLNERKRCVHVVQLYRKPFNGLACSCPRTSQCCLGAPVSLPWVNSLSFTCVFVTRQSPTRACFSVADILLPTTLGSQNCPAPCLSRLGPLPEQLFLTRPVGCAKCCEKPGEPPGRTAASPCCSPLSSNPSITFFLPPQAPQSRPLGPLLLQGSQWRGRDPLVVSDLLDWSGLLKLLPQKPQAPSPIPVWDHCDKGLVSIP